MYTIKYTSKFKKSYRLMVKQGKDVSLLDKVIENLSLGNKLDPKYSDHQLSGNYRMFRECHVKPDWLLIYMIEDNILTLTLVDTGSHSNIIE